jgi:hypothetical protein
VGSEETRTGPGSEDTGKVVRIPRDWYGPKDELVPVGPRASESPPPTAGASEQSRPVDPNAFWGEEASFVHDAVEGSPTVASELPVGEWRRSRRLVAGGIAVALLASGVAVWLSAASSTPIPRAVIASMPSEPWVSPAHRLARVSADSVVRRRAKAHARAAQSHPSDATRIPTPTQVVYRPVSSSSGGADRTSAASSGDSTAATSGGRAGTAAPASIKSSPQPAFGANGALGPMSSPDG